jgi:hypothetical protein
VEEEKKRKRKKENEKKSQKSWGGSMFSCLERCKDGRESRWL